MADLELPPKPSPSREALKAGLTRCRRHYPDHSWPAQTDADGWRQLAERWESGCYGMDDVTFLRAIGDHLEGPYERFVASPGHLWVAVDLRAEGYFDNQEKSQ